MLAHRPRSVPDARWLGLGLAPAIGLMVIPLEGAPTLCPFALATGIACPGCGLTRAAASLARGDAAQAFAFHPLLLVVVAWIVTAAAIWWRRRRGVPSRLSPQSVNRFLIATAAVFAVTWVVRLATGTLPPV